MWLGLDIMKSKDSKNGVAVIIVLGMLALLMMMGVAFSVSMRIERRSAGNYSHSVATKNMVWVALARAMDDIEDQMEAGGGHVYPTSNVWVSSGGGGNVSLGRGDALDYIPGTAADLAYVTTSEWNNIEVVWKDGDNNDVTNIPGRYAYLILNCSDFIDANYAGGATNRMGGVNASELQLVPSIMNSTELTDLIDARNLDVRYETLQELYELSGIKNDNLVVYSRYPTNDGLVSLAGSVAELTPRISEISPLLRSSIYRANSGDFLFNSLIDYIDTDSVPHNNELNKAYVERVPMINEVRIKNIRLRRTLSDAEFIRRDIAIELAFPFVEKSSENFSVLLDVVTEVTGGVSPHTYNFTTNIITAAGNIAEDYELVSVSLPRETVQESNNVPLTVAIEIKGKVSILGGADDGTAVDECPSPYTKDGFKFTFNAGISPNFTKNDEPSLECVDPRFNWDVDISSGEEHWKVCTHPDANTMNSINSVTEDWFLNNTHAEGYDTNMQMRVSNRGYLVSVGELGNLLRRAHRRWKYNTVRLYEFGHGRDDIYEVFKIKTNSVNRGMVNVNSAELGLIVPGLLAAPIKYLESVDQVDTPTAESIALEIINHGLYTNVFDVCGFDWQSIPKLRSLSNLEIESIISHSYGLFGTRQNLFAIIIAASPVTANMGTFAATQGSAVTSGGKRAIVYVWRDPFPDADDKHKCFVQFFKWL